MVYPAKDNLVIIEIETRQQASQERFSPLARTLKKYIDDR